MQVGRICVLVVQASLGIRGVEITTERSRRRRDQHPAPMAAPPTSSPARYRLGFQPALLRPELPAGNRLFRLHDEEIAVRAVAKDTFEELIPVKGDHDVLRPPTPV